MSTGNVGASTAYNNILSSGYSGGGYRDYLQDIANKGGLTGQEARGLLEVVGNDYNVNSDFLSDPYRYTGNDRGQIAVNSWDNPAEKYWYGPQGVSSLNSIYSSAYKKNQGKVLGTDTGPTSTSGTGVDTRAYQTQIDRINQLLGTYVPQKESGINSIDNRFNEEKRRLGENRTKATVGYDDQNTQAVAARTRGYEQVDDFANNSAKSLSRIFQGANAGNSSVARLLAPQLVGKAADSRRLDVTTTANENIGNIKKARDDAITEFDYADQDLENNRGYEKEAFEKGIVQNELDQYNQRLALEQEAGFSTTGSQNEINSRTNRLSQLLGAGKFNPQYQVRAVAPRAVSLNDYKIDPVQLQAGQNTQTSDSYYNPLLRKKQELRVR